MGIRKEQPGASKAAAKTGLTIGKGKRAEEDRARGEREQARAAQQAARQAAMEWEATKMRMRSEQDFQQELATKQWDYEKFNRAKAWDIEKMEIRSRNDLDMDEKERVRDIDLAQNLINSLEKSAEDGILSKGDDQYKLRMSNAVRQLDAAKTGRNAPIAKKLPEETLTGMLRKKEEAATETAKGVKTFTNPKTKEPVYVPEGQSFVNVQHPTKGLQSIRVEQLEEAMAEGAIYVPKKAGPIKKHKETVGIDDETFYLHSGAYGGT